MRYFLVFILYTRADTGKQGCTDVSIACEQFPARAIVRWMAEQHVAAALHIRAVPRSVLVTGVQETSDTDLLHYYQLLQPPPTLKPAALL